MQETPVEFLGWEGPQEKGQATQYSWASPVTQLVKNPPAMRETWLLSLGWENPLEKGKATRSSILTWRIPQTVYIVHGIAKSQTGLSNFCFHLHRSQYYCQITQKKKRLKKVMFKFHSECHQQFVVSQQNLKCNCCKKFIKIKCTIYFSRYIMNFVRHFLSMDRKK